MELVKLICDFAYEDLKYFQLLRSDGKFSWQESQKIVHVLEMIELEVDDNDPDYWNAKTVLDGLKLSVKLQKNIEIV